MSALESVDDIVRRVEDAAPVGWSREALMRDAIVADRRAIANRLRALRESGVDASRVLLAELEGAPEAEAHPFAALPGWLPDGSRTFATQPVSMSGGELPADRTIGGAPVDPVVEALRDFALGAAQEAAWCVEKARGSVDVLRGDSLRAQGATLGSAASAAYAASKGER